MNETLSERAAAAARDLTDRADREGLLDVAYAPLDTPIGRLLLAATERGLARVAFPEEEAVLDELARRLSPRILEAPARLDGARRELDEYFAGRREVFEIPLDWRLADKGFRHRVLVATATIPYGALSTYRDVATEAGNAKASRAAGQAVGSNPIPVVVPCHRVVGSNGSLTGYGGGLPRKLFLLELEGAILAPGGAR